MSHSNESGNFFVALVLWNPALSCIRATLLACPLPSPLFWIWITFSFFLVGQSIVPRWYSPPWVNEFNENYASSISKHGCHDFFSWNCSFKFFFAGEWKGLKPLLILSVGFRRVLGNLGTSNNGVEKIITEFIACQKPVEGLQSIQLKCFY